MAASRARQIFHSHQLHYQTSPSGKVLRALSCASLRVVLLPSKAGFLPALVDGVNEVLTQACVQIGSLVTVRAALLGDMLVAVSYYCTKSK